MGPHARLVTTQPCTHVHPHADSKNESSYMRIQVLAEFLENHFGEVELHMPDEAGEDQHEQDEESNRDPALILRVDEADAYINLVTLVSYHFFYVAGFVLMGLFSLDRDLCERGAQKTHRSCT